MTRNTVLVPVHNNHNVICHMYLWSLVFTNNSAIGIRRSGTTIIKYHGAQLFQALSRNLYYHEYCPHQRRTDEMLTQRSQISTFSSVASLCSMLLFRGSGLVETK